MSVYIHLIYRGRRQVEIMKHLYKFDSSTFTHKCQRLEQKFKKKDKVKQGD